ncbi:MAG: HAMP domain-containing protein, partial [Deltaproteobacteria bacterium]|nr:HAMP domain-containing protein [Deltaproteobacteria bacterium]
MRIKNLKIATQLELALGSLLLLFVVLCVLSWNHGNSLWRQTATLYNHPMTVQMAVAKINAAVLGSQGALRDMLLTGDTPQSVHAIEADMDLVDQQLTLVADRYLGPRSDIALVQNAFTDWKKNLDEALRALAPTPRTDSSAPALVRRADTATQTLLDCIEPLSSFAESQATQIYTQAEADQQRMFPRLSAFLILLALVCGSMLFHLLASLRTPLRELTRTAGRLQRGDFSQRVAIESRNEFGMLGAAFNTLAGTVSAELSLKEDLVLLAEVMLRKGDLHAFCRNVLSALIHHTSSHNGAV